MRRAFVVCLSATSVMMTAMDYEYQPANHLAFRCADLVAVPEVFPPDRLLAQGARPVGGPGATPASRSTSPWPGS